MEFEEPEIVESFNDIEIYKKDAFINKIGIAAMQEEEERVKKAGVPVAFMHDGKILYHLPDGTVSSESPWDKYYLTQTHLL